MALYWSPSKGRFIESNQSSGSGGGGGSAQTKTRPKTYYSPKSHNIVHSFDGQQQAYKPKGHDPEKNRNIIGDILGKIERFEDFQKRVSKAEPKFSDLTAENQQKAARLEAAGGEPAPERKENFLSRAIDILSRPLYASANVAQGAAERTRTTEDELERTLTDEEKGIRGQRGRGISKFLPELVLGKSDKVKTLEQKVEKAKRPAIGLPEIGQRAQEGFTGKAKTTYADVINTIDPDAPNWAKAAFGFAGDVAMDPLILVPGYVFTKPFTAGGKLIRSTTPSARANKKAGEALASKGEELRQAFQREVDTGVIDSKLFDRVVSADPKVTGAERVKAASLIVEDLGGRYGAERFTEFFETNLNQAVRDRRISQEVADRLRDNRHFETMQDAVDAVSKSAMRVRAAASEATSADDAVRSGLRSWVETLMERGRVSQAIGQATQKGKNVDDLNRQLDDINRQLDKAGLPKSITERLKSKEFRGLLNTPRLRGLHSGALSAQRWANHAHALVAGKKGSASTHVNRSINGIYKASDKQLKYAITRAIGPKSNAATRDISRIVDEYMNTVARPAITDEQAWHAWHAGLFESLSKGMRGAVADDIAEVIAKETGNAEIFAGVQPIVPSAVRSNEMTDQVFRHLGPPIDDEVKAILKETRDQAENVGKDFEKAVLDVVARADAAGVGSDTFKSVRALDEHLDKYSSLDAPVLAERSFNKAIQSFNSLFRPKAGLDPRINELRLRYMGMANENIAYRANKLKDVYKGTNAKDRIAEFNQYRVHGVKDDAGRIQAFEDEIAEILRPYTSEFSTHAYGPGGRFTLGDLSRWLPDKYKLPHELRKSEEPLKTWEAIFEQVLKEPAIAAGKSDPMEVLWNFMIANEKVFAEKATLHALADTFGVTKSSLAGSALSGGKLGYVKNKRKFGDEVYFHPEVSRQIDKFFDLVHSPRPTNAFISYLDAVNNVYKQVVTTLNPVGFNVRNSMGDAFTGFLDGVSGRHGLASYRQALKVMKMRGGLDDAAQEAVHSFGAKAAHNPRNAVFRLPNGQSVSGDEVLALYNKHGLSSGFVQTEFGAAGNLRPGSNMLGRGIVEPAQKLAQNQADFFRLAHFIDKMKRSKHKSLDDAAQEAAEAVRKFKFDYNDFTPVEKTVFSRLIPFYKFTRKNLPLMTQMLFAQPEKMLRVPKGLSAISQLTGVETEGLRPTSADSVLPEWISNRGMWPIAEWQGETIYAKPDIQVFDPFTFGQGGISSVTDMSTPALRVPYELATGQQMINNTTRDISDKRGDYLLGQIPQTRDTQRMLSEEDRNLGQFLRIIGLGTTQNTAGMQSKELGREWARFFATPEGKRFKNDPPPKEITKKQLRYLLDLMAQQNGLDRNF